MTSSQLSEWEAYDKLDPIGEWRWEFSIANLMALIANVNRDIKKAPNPYKPLDFMPQWDKEHEERPQQTAEEQKKIFLDIFSNLKKKKK